MKKQQIKEMMLEIINEEIKSRKMEILEQINEEDVKEFMWTKNYGRDLVDDFIDEKDLINNYLQEILESISFDNFDIPF